MQFEEFDDKIKEAAENHHPAYDENAWARMEVLLNKHLPQENDRRRRFILFYFYSCSSVPAVFGCSVINHGREANRSYLVIQQFINQPGNLPHLFLPMRKDQAMIVIN
jgi:hypothetical protein